MKLILEVASEAPAPRPAYPVSLPRNIYCALFVIEIFIVVAQLPSSPKRKLERGKHCWDKVLSWPGAFFKTISSVCHTHRLAPLHPF